MSNLLENNAYRILGLDTTASPKEVLRRYKEIINRLEISDQPKYDLDIDLPEKFRTEAAAKGALKELQSAKGNIREYFFWFQISNANDKRAMDCLISGEVSKAIQIWKDLSENDNAIAFLYKKNLAILYCLMLLREDNPKYLKNSLSNWKEIINSEKFWISFSKNYNLQNEQTLSEENMSSFKEAVAKELSDIYADLGQRYKNQDYIRNFQELFGTHGKRTEKDIMQPIYQEIYDSIEELKKIRISDDDGQVANETEFKEKLDKIYDISDTIQKKLGKLRKNGLYDESESKVVRDRAAFEIRERAVELHNHVHLYEESTNLIKIAARISGTTSYKSGLKIDEGKIQQTMEADTKSLLTVWIPTLFSSNPVEFKPRFVEYKDTKIFYKDIRGIYFCGVRSNYSTTYSFMVVSDWTKFVSKIAFSFSDAETWTKLTGISTQLIIPSMVKKYADSIFNDDQTVNIGGIKLDKFGYARQKFAGGTDSVSWADKIYIPQFLSGNVVLYKERDGKASMFETMSMSELNAVILPTLLEECVNRAFAKGIYTRQINPTKQIDKEALKKLTESFTITSEGKGSNMKDEYERINKAERPKLLKDFEENGGKKLSKAEIDALKLIRADSANYVHIDSQVLEQLIDKDYVRREGFISKYVIQAKGYKILNWVLYKYK